MQCESSDSDSLNFDGLFDDPPSSQGRKRKASPQEKLPRKKRRVPPLE